MRKSLSFYVDLAINAAINAGQVIRPYFGSQELSVYHKEDKTPVTLADNAAHEVISAFFNNTTPEIPLLSEEGITLDYEIRQQWQQYWLVDPLDGTRGFMQKSSEFTVNIALIDGQQPVLGVLYAPMHDVLYWAFKDGGAFKRYLNIDRKLFTKINDPDKLTILLGRYQNRKWVEPLCNFFPNIEFIFLNSALKFGYLAEGRGDIYVGGPTSEWDTAAGQCILHEAGGVVVDFDEKTLQYNAKESLQNPQFVAAGDQAILKRLLPLLPGYKLAT